MQSVCAAVLISPRTGFPSCRCSTISWAESKRILTDELIYPACMPVVKPPVQAYTVQTDLQAIRFWNAWFSAGEAPVTSAKTQVVLHRTSHWKYAPWQMTTVWILIRTAAKSGHWQH